MLSVPLLIGVLGYAAAAAAYAVIAGLVLISHPGTRQANWIIGASLVSAAWAGMLAYAIWSVGSLSAWLPILDAVHTAAWVLFLAGMLTASAQAKLATRVGRGLGISAVALVVLAILFRGPAEGISAVAIGNQTVFLALLGLPLLGLLGLEQIFRNSTFEQRRVLRPLSLGVGAVFAIDVFVYSQAVLFGEVNSTFWLLRGVANAGAAPLVLLAVKREPAWERELFVSRQVVFYTTSLMGAGLYLLAMGIGGFLIGTRGGTWGPWLQIVFLGCAGAVFLYALFSAAVRRRLKVFIAKHFYRNRYDYREEWLRLIKTLAGTEHATSLSERSVKALADIIGSRRGELWLVNRTRTAYEGHGALGMPLPTNAIDANDVLPRFLRQTRWIIDTNEYSEDPEKYTNAFVAAPEHVAKPSIYVPLVHANDLVGIVRLDRPPMLGSLGFEDHDLLRTAGQQVATFLAQEHAQEELAETRQFEAFSKLTAFLMHDLKNMIAQQELVVGNARRFKHRPEFIDDAIGTIEASVGRMKAVLERLRGATGVEKKSRVDLQKLLYEICNGCADRSPVPEIVTAPIDARVDMDREKLNMAIVHAIRNAQDATPPGGRVQVRLEARDGTALIEVGDTGMGMTPEFIRDHLFKPFDSTKGAKGMGIGAYQIRETLRAAGGDVEVSSTPGQGTTVRMRLPLAEASSTTKQAAAGVL
jgi:putative PEP-CTERM system histidine kinase